jgi:hypothetical protein
VVEPEIEQLILNSKRAHMEYLSNPAALHTNKHHRSMKQFCKKTVRGSELVVTMKELCAWVAGPLVVSTTLFAKVPPKV